MAQPMCELLCHAVKNEAWKIVEHHRRLCTSLEFCGAADKLLMAAILLGSGAMPTAEKI